MNKVSAKQVVVVEDNPFVCKQMVDSVQQSGRYKVTRTFSTLDSALSLWAKTTADLFVIDLGLPDGDGENLIRDIRLKSSSIKILVVTLFSDDTRFLNAIRAGADGFLSKDESPAKLIEALDSLTDGGTPLTASVASCLLRDWKSLQGKTSAKPETSPLTKRESEVLRHVAHGLSNDEIAEQLNVTINTIRAHTKSIFRKLSVHTRSAAIYQALDNGILQL